MKIFYRSICWKASKKKDLLSNNERILIVRSEEVMITIGFSRLSSILSHIEDSGVYSNPIEITGQLLSDVCLASGGQTDHCDHMRDIHISGRPIS